MSALRTLRQNRSLTFLDLASLTGIPARALAEAEYGLRSLARNEREGLAMVLGIHPADLRELQAAAPDARAGLPAAPALLAAALAATLATAALQGELPRLGAPPLPGLAAKIAPATQIASAAGNALAGLTIAPASAQAALARAATLAALRALADRPADPVAPDLLLAPAPARPAPAFQLTDAGPRGCPVQPAAGRAVLTQGYGVGSHAPASVWGAVDIAVDGDGDGYAEPAASWYAPVVATHAGVVRVSLDSYPAGNHVWVVDEASGWRTGYAHLALVGVISGQRVRPGELIGSLGSSGVSSGPHLDYQVWRGETNFDPTELVACR